MLPRAQIYYGVSGVVLFAVLTVLAVAGFAYSSWRRFRAMLLGRPENRGDRILMRAWLTVKYGILQRRLWQDMYAGVMHALIFWGFVVLTVRNAAFILEGLAPGIGPPGGGLGHAYTFAKEVVELLVVVGLAMAFYRRVRWRQGRLRPTFDAWVILFLIGLLIATDLLAEVSRNALEPSRRGWWCPVTSTMASVLAVHPTPWWKGFYSFCWWAHLLDILVFANYLPYSKHLHIIAALPNVFAQKLSPMGQLASADLEEAESFGADSIRDFTWKALLDGYACTECGRCSAACPTALTGKPLDPRAFIGAFRDALFEDTRRMPARSKPPLEGANGAKGSDKAAKPLIGGWVSEEAIWACTTCGYCTAVCPVFISPVVDKVVEMRRCLVLERAQFPKEMQTAFRGMETNGNPWGMGAATRGDWAKEQNVVTMAEGGRGQVDYLFWVGCAGSYEERGKRVSRAFVEILQQAGVKFGILGAEERCTGDAARRMGNEYLFQELARQNIATLNGYGVRKIVTNCPHCLNCLKNEYPQFGGNYDVVHGTELVAELIAHGRLTLEREISGTITYHDSCYLGRYNGTYEAPRMIIKAIPGLKLEEMKHSRQDGLCCGAGGGRMWMEERLGQPINQMRMKEIAASGAAKAAVSCPFCSVMLDNVKEGICAHPPVVDVLELALMAIAPGPRSVAADQERDPCAI